jgi:hypothetical protein
MDTITKKVEEVAYSYEESFQFLQARKKRQANQLKLLVNLQKGDQNISSTLLLTLFNRLLSSLYDDKLQVKFLPSQGIIQEQISAYNILAQSDYIEMNKAKIDYDWCWDTLFYGRGYVETQKFNKKRKIMEPHVINPLVFGYDPISNEVQDWRYYWKWISKNKWEINKLIKNGTITGISDAKEIPSGVDPYLWEYKTIVEQARDGIMPSPDPGTLDIFQILEFYYYDDDGDKAVCWVDKNFSMVLMQEKLNLDDDGEGGSKWPIVVKEGYRQPHSSLPFSVADLLDDKHRAKSVLLNLALIAAKDEANPVYWYDSDKVDDVTQFLSRQVNQHIPVSGNGAEIIGPINKANSMSPELIQFISVLTQEANDPIGTGQTMQPNAAKGDKTATGDAINQQLNDMAQSILSKVMQFGEQEFWSHWFHRYAQHADSLGTKMANIVGVKGVDTKEVDLGLFNTDFPPGVMVYSAKEAEYKELVKRRDYMQLYPELAQTLDQDGMRNFNKYVFFPMFLNDPSLVDVVFPKTIDELKAESENLELEADKYTDPLPTDNHTTHIYIHNMIPPGKKTWAMWFHIAAHEQMLGEQKAQELQAQQMAMQQGQPSGSPPGGALGGKGQVGKEKSSPMSQASPLATELKNK